MHKKKQIPVPKIHAFKSRLDTNIRRIVTWTSLDRGALMSGLVNELEDAYAWILGSIDEPPFETGETILIDERDGHYMCSCCEWRVDKHGYTQYRHCPGCGRAIKRELKELK